MSIKYYQSKELLLLESGAVLPAFTLAYHTYGSLNAEGNNVIWICHALTANSDAQTWWPGLIGDGLLFDTAKYFVVCANILGSCYGSTGPLSKNPNTDSNYYGDFPLITIRDLVKGHKLLKNHLQINQIELLIGASLGGQQALEWAIDEPNSIQKLVLIATNAKHSAWGIAFNEAQRMAIKADVTFGLPNDKAGSEGLKAARATAMLSYRSYASYLNSQNDAEHKIDGFKSSSYQQYQGFKLSERFNAYSYWTLSKAMDSHHVGRNRNSIENALQKVKAQTVVLGIVSDQLFPTVEQEFLASTIPNAQLHLIDSIYGHDGFLIETEQISKILHPFIHPKLPIENYVKQHH